MDTSPEESSPPLCSKSRKCNRARFHQGRCNSKRLSREFWEKSPNFALKTSRETEAQQTLWVAEIESREKQVALTELEINSKKCELESFAELAEERVEIAKNALDNAVLKKEEVDRELEDKQRKLEDLNSQFDKLKTLLDQKGYARTRRQNTATTFETITSNTSSVRYRRRNESKSVLEYIHGGEEPSMYGAWDVLAAGASKQMMDQFISSYKRGKYLEGVVSKALKENSQSNESLKKAVALKYQNFLSRRKFNLLCQTQSSAFDAEQEIWVPRNMKVLGVDMKVNLGKISSDSVEKFVRSLDIGSVSQIPNVPGVTRTVTGLVFMIIDLHLRLPHLFRKLVWFNDNINHFIFQFSDDGAPETSMLTMSIGSLTFWNLGERVRSRDFQYLVHCVSLSEKDKVLELLWEQHTDEMLLLESSIFTICGRECTMQFQPSADMSWQCWAGNELNNAATYPSPYANVHKDELAKLEGALGDGDEMWKPYSNAIREDHIKKVKDFQKSLPKSNSESTCHNKTLEFMAQNGIRQMGKPRIGVFAERLMPEPLHCEINAWQNILDITYHEALLRNRFNEFISILSGAIGSEIFSTGDCAEALAPGTESNEEVTILDESLCEVTENSSESMADGINDLSQMHGQFSTLGIENLANVNLATALRKSPPVASSSKECGCGLSFISRKIQEHYRDESKCQNRLPVRLIGAQAISLARYGYRLVDCLAYEGEIDAQKVKRMALSKAIQYLRNASGLFNKININSAELAELEEFCKLYFSLLALFFPSYVNITVWTVGYAIPYHARKLYNEYRIGFGILSLQAKESKHAGIKRELILTNRSTESSVGGKWWQIMRSNYVRSFYLPEHQPSPPTYSSHFKSRTPSHCELPQYCDCGRKKVIGSLSCVLCNDSYKILDCALQQKLLPELIFILKPISCPECDKRFSDKNSLELHSKVHKAKGIDPQGQHLNPQAMSVDALKKALKDRGLNTQGRKEILKRRLESVMEQT